jgi:membrane-associated phospholipid phosphatase
LDKRVNKIDEFKANLWYLLFWPAYILGFILLEMLNEGKQFHLVHCFIDDIIPFNEWFVIPYLTWHPLIAIVLLYTLVCETENFRKLSKYFILTFTVTIVIYLIYPTCLELRPETVPMVSILSYIVKFIYTVDTPENVSPSLHIIGMFGMFFWSWDARGKLGLFWKIIMVIATVLIVMSTMFIKQHSVVDVVVALPVAFIGWLLCFRGKEMEDISEGIQ